MIHVLEPGNPSFPPISEGQHADYPLAMGGELSVAWLSEGYRRGIFPWFSEDEPVLWWCPDPRMVLFPERLRISRSMKQVLRSGRFRFTVDGAFMEVITACAKLRKEGGTWIGPDIIAAYAALHRAGYAHSVEVWEGEQLVGGLYGVAVGDVFCGESMFSHVSNASKAGFIMLVQALVREGFRLIDCQVYTHHLASLGAEEIPRKKFLDLLAQKHPASLPFAKWDSLDITKAS